MTVVKIYIGLSHGFMEVFQIFTGVLESVSETDMATSGVKPVWCAVYAVITPAIEFHTFECVNLSQHNGVRGMHPTVSLQD